MQMWGIRFILLICGAAHAKIDIIKPFPKNICPVEGTDVAVTCVTRDLENKTMPDRIVFMKEINGQFHNLTGQEPRVTFKPHREMGNMKLLTTMYIKNVTEKDGSTKKSDATKYECWFFESGNSQRVDRIGFDVCVIPKKYVPLIQVSADVVASFKDKVSLTCNVTYQEKEDDTKLKTITWTKDDKLLKEVMNPNPGNPAETLKPFTIGSVEPKDGGTYTCTLLVELRKKTEVKITGNVTVSVKPKFVSDIANQELKYKKGEEVKFECGAIGFPLRVEWKRRRKNEKKLRCINDTEDRYSITRKDTNSFYVLNIEDVTYEDRGKYFCCLPTNCSDSSEGCQEWTLRVKDPLGALWPFIGIITEAIVLFVIIFITGRVKGKNEKVQKDNRVEFSCSSTGEQGDRGNVRLRKMDPVNA